MLTQKQNSRRNRARHGTSLLFALVALFCASVAQGQQFPTKPIRWIIPLPAGTLPDGIARLLLEEMGSVLGGRVLIDNRSGASGIPAIAELLRAPPDGHTLLGVDASHWAILPAIRSDLTYDVMRDFAPVALVYSTPQFIVVREQLGVRDLRELIALIRAKPGALQYGSVGTGSISHLSFESFKAPLGLAVLHIPYKGSTETIPALLRGDVSITMIGLPAVLPFAKTGQVRVLASSGGTRFKAAPDIPTIAEAGGPSDFNMIARFAMVALAGTPRSLIDKISAAAGKAASNPKVAAHSLAANMEMTPSGPERLLDIFREDIRVFGAAAKAAGIAEGK